MRVELKRPKLALVSQRIRAYACRTRNVQREAKGAREAKRSLQKASMLTQRIQTRTGRRTMQQAELKVSNKAYFKV